MTAMAKKVLVALILVALCGSKSDGREIELRREERAVDPSENCKCRCTVFGDPHLQKFLGSIFRLPLPCAHKLVDVRTPRRDGGCSIRINGRALYTEPNGLDGANFERLIHVRVEFDDSVFTAIFNGSDPPVTELTGPNQTLAEAGIIALNTPGHQSYDIQKCHIKLRYLPNNSSFTVKASVNFIGNRGMCGRCPPTNVTNDNNTETLVLRRTLRYLEQSSPIDNSNMDVYPVCADLNAAVQNCPPDTNPFPRLYCGPMLNDEGIRNCLKNKLNGNLALLQNFEDCYSTTCEDGNVTTCAGPDQFYHDCASAQTISDLCHP